MNTSTGNPCGHQEQQKDLSVDEEPLLQKECIGSHRGDSDEPQPRRRGQGSQVRRQYITQRWVDEHGVTPGCPRCEGRGTMSHSEKCRKRFESIEKENLDKQLEEATRHAEPPLVITAEMDVEQPREQQSTGGVSSSSVLAQSGQEAVALSSPTTHEVRMETAEPSSSTRPLEGGDEGSSKRVRSLAGMLLFDENDTFDWQHSVHETRTSELSDDKHDQHDSTDHMQQPDTDIPGVWRWQVERKTDLYGDRTGKLMDPEKVVGGRLTELKHTNDHHVYDWIDEANIPKGTKIETLRWCDDIKPRDGDETNVRSRIVVQQYNVVKHASVEGSEDVGRVGHEQ